MCIFCVFVGVNFTNGVQQAIHWLTQGICRVHRQDFSGNILTSLSTDCDGAVKTVIISFMLVSSFCAWIATLMLLTAAWCKAMLYVAKTDTGEALGQQTNLLEDPAAPALQAYAGHTVTGSQQLYIRAGFHIINAQPTHNVSEFSYYRHEPTMTYPPLPLILQQKAEKLCLMERSGLWRRKSQTSDSNSFINVSCSKMVTSGFSSPSCK